MHFDNPVVIWWMDELLDDFYPDNRQPPIQLVRWVFDMILVAVGFSPLAVGYIFGFVSWAITAIIAFPLFITVVGMMLVSEAIALFLANVYRIITRWTSRIWRRILGVPRGNFTADQLPTINTPLVNATPKQSPVSSLNPTTFIETKNDERGFALHSNPVTTMKYIPSGPAPVFPSPCAEIRGRSREIDPHVIVFSPPPPPYS
ncbi:hypothetical protein BELL_0158g00100 [Botrytis elliptica]|uniref:Uncharacterized protein n=1 Tax=Botrytis elliptica TaxID=278938 RepID=A0A4Z1JXJ1_9HELO|nr:hypothetical protein EAE99_000454 [Botrytis elliptica]TGO76390.1 hypothetical protein BELL_0158g00100 [Botrytis elliptica]